MQRNNSKQYGFQNPLELLCISKTILHELKTLHIVIKLIEKHCFSISLVH